MCQPCKIVGFTILTIIIIAIIYRVLLAKFNVTSWFRTPWRNKELGGVAGSLHLIGWAFDVAPGGPATVQKVKDLPLPFGRIIDEGSHVHAQIV